MTKQSNRPLAGLLPVLAIALVSGCASLGDNMPPEEAVTVRAQAWADAVLARDLDAAWEFTTPNYRKNTSVQLYSGEVAGSRRWTAVKVGSVDCEVDVCEVRVMVDYTVKRLKMSNSRPLDYKWLLVDGRWWLHVPASR
ncbi:MAG: hypothetical protein ACI9JM_002168 [Halioglobus sp.]|jgi:hypothetical protein